MITNAKIWKSRLTPTAAGYLYFSFIAKGPVGFNSTTFSTFPQHSQLFPQPMLEASMRLRFTIAIGIFLMRIMTQRHLPGVELCIIERLQVRPALINQIP